jgi:hypothetical protein
MRSRGSTTTTIEGVEAGAEQQLMLDVMLVLSITGRVAVSVSKHCTHCQHWQQQWQEQQQVGEELAGTLSALRDWWSCISSRNGCTRCFLSTARHAFRCIFCSARRQISRVSAAAACQSLSQAAAKAVLNQQFSMNCVIAAVLQSHVQALLWVSCSVVSAWLPRGWFDAATFMLSKMAARQGSKGFHLSNGCDGLHVWL